MRWRCAVALAVCGAGVTLAIGQQVSAPNEANRLLKQCSTVDDYSKLPGAQAKECVAWDAQQEEEHAAMHMGGIEQADKDAEDAQAGAAAAVRPLLEKLTPAQRLAYRELLASFRGFLSVQVSGGVLYLPPYAPAGFDGGGQFPSEYLHAHFGVSVAHAIRHRTDLPGMYTDGDNAVTGFAPPSLEQADAKLNASWRRLAGNLDRANQAGVLEKLHVEQRAWLAFRDSFAAFAVTVSRGVDRSTWVAAMEANRADEIAALDAVAVLDAQNASGRP